MAVDMLTIFATAGLPVVNVFLMCSLGAALAYKGILDSRGRQLLSQLIFWVFVPALTFTTLADSVNLQKLAVWWVLPFNMLVSILLGMVCGWIAGRLFDVPHWFRKHFICCAALGNVGNLPLVLVSSVCTAKTPFRAALGGQCERRGIAYVAFSMWVASTFQYCVAYNLLKRKDEGDESVAEMIAETEKTLGLRDSDVVLQMTALPKRSPQLTEDTSQRRTQLGRDESTPLELQVVEEHDITAFPSDRPKETNAHELSADRRPVSHLQNSRWERPGSEDEEDDSLLVSKPDSQGEDFEASSSERSERRGWWQKMPLDCSSTKKKRKEIQRWLKCIPWGSYLNLPTLAAAAGLTVGCVSILKRLLFGNSPPLLFVTQSLETMAGAMIPCMMLVLGGSLAEGPRASDLPSRVIVGTILVRLLLMPAIGTGVVVLMVKSGAARPPDTLFTLTLLLCHAPPTAMNLQTVATLNRNGEGELSRILCWQYLSALITLPLWMSLFVYLVPVLSA